MRAMGAVLIIFGGILFFFVSMPIGAVAGLLGILMMVFAPSESRGEIRYRCPYCKNYVLPDASMCPTCHGTYTPIKK